MGEPKGFVLQGEFGFVDDPADLLPAIAWRDAAIADGWACEPTYGAHESWERACKLHREGWTARILTRREEAHQRRHCASVHVWAPDGLAVKPPPFYSWTALQAGVRTCNLCGAADVETRRYSFAGRCCHTCASQPGHDRKYHYPGWNR